MNILVTGPPLTGKRRLALAIIANGAADDEGAIIVSTRDSAERVLTDYRSIHDEPVESAVGVIDTVSEYIGHSPNDGDHIKYTASPTDLTGIGVKFSELIESYHAEKGVKRNRVLVDSLSTLLLYSNLQTVFRFLHVFTSRVENAGALGVYTIESTVHDAETMNTLRQLFDGVIETDRSGGATINVPGVNCSSVDL